MNENHSLIRLYTVHEFTIKLYTILYTIYIYIYIYIYRVEFSIAQSAGAVE